MQDAGFPLTLTRTVFRQWASAFFSTCLQEQKAQEHAGSEGDNNGIYKKKNKNKNKTYVCSARASNVPDDVSL